MTAERCSACGRGPLLWSGGRLICGNVNCTAGHQPTQEELPPKEAA